MDTFSTQYLTSGKGLVRAMPIAARALKLSDNLVAAAIFIDAFMAFFFVELAKRALPLVWPRYPEGVPLALGLIIAAVIFLFVILPWSRGRTARRMDQLLPHMPTRLVVGGEGISISDGVSHCQWGWAHIHGAVETLGGVVVLVGYSGTFVPTDAFRDEVERAAFIELLNRRGTAV